MFNFQYKLYLLLAFAQLFWFMIELSHLFFEANFIELLLKLEDIAELLLFFSSFITLLYLYNNHKKNQQEMQRLQQHLKQTKQSLDKVNLRLKKTGFAYYEAIKYQLLDWHLTRSEQDVALLILKGLSFKEIATIRQTQEKTVRQQATSIYGKAQLKGRHEFSAYFFEDFLAATH